MHRALLIIQREYLTRVKKKTFLLITFLAPLLFAFIILAPTLLAQMTDSQKTIYVVDESGHFKEVLKDKADIDFVFVDKKISVVQDELLANNPDNFILKIPDFELDNPQGFEIMGKQSPSLTLSNDIEETIEEKIRDLKIKKAGLSEDVLANLNTNIDLGNIVLQEGGKKQESSTSIAYGVSMIGGFLMYFFIFMYGGQVTTGVHEEKTSRIVEILISSVRPVQLMFGKIVGIALVGLTQFLLWLLLTGVVSGVLMAVMGPSVFADAQASGGPSAAMADQEAQQAMLSNILESLGSINFPLIIFSFIFYFLIGYFMYSSLFAGVAAAVDNQTDMRQFMFPLSIPLILAIVVTPTVILTNPNSGIAIAGSLIPFTSPVVMMARIPFGVPPLELIGSYLLMILGFILCVWLAAKVYRTGILMYGKKVTPREIMRWMVKG